MRFIISTIASALISLSTFAQTSPVASVESRAVQTLPGWDYQGCYTDLVKARGLTGSFYFDAVMTAEKCSIACQRFSYFGLEYGRECFCGDTLNAPSALTVEKECTYQCLGKAGQTCGDAPKMNVYKKSITAPIPAAAIPKYAPVACVVDNTNSRVLKGAVVFDSGMTRDMCASICTGWPVFGLEYGRECFCGTGIPSGVTMVDGTQCNTLCAGNAKTATTTCGAPLRLDVFKYSS